MCEHAWKFVGTFSGGMADYAVAPPAGCDAPAVLGCSLCGDVLAVRCMSTRESKCKPCAKRYRGTVARVALSGTRGSVAAAEALFVTLTAPGVKRHRNLRTGQWCECTPEDGTDLAEWNGRSGRRWQHLMRQLRRDLGHGVWGRIEYFRASEAQDRGALHFHVLLRRSDGGPLYLDETHLRRLALAFGFGHEVDVSAYEPKHARYVAKYVAKSADAREAVPWKGTRRRSMQSWRGVPYRVREVRFMEHTTVPTYRTWVASRGWGDTIARVRADQAHYAATWAALPDWVIVVRGCQVTHVSDALWIEDDIPRPDRDLAPLLA